MIELTVGQDRERQQQALVSYITDLPRNKAFIVEVKPHKCQRSIAQNRYLFGVVYRKIRNACPDQAFTSEALHEYWLGECFGWDVCDVLGYVRKVPAKRSSKLSTEEFSDFCAFIQRRCVETMGLYIPDPNEMENEK